MDYRQAIDYIYSFANLEVTPALAHSPEHYNLARMERLLSALGDPHKAFPSVHIAGTKGKGSTAAMIESVLRAAGLRTGLYTSPHLHTFRERIRVAGEMIPRESVVSGIEKIQPTAAGIEGLSTFEIMTALAFDYFAQRRIEMGVLEVGLGGRLDSTNVVIPRVSVITSISYDHTAVLGNTLEQIAGEKAGIAKPGIPLVTSPQRDPALQVIAQAARDRQAPFVSVDSDLSYTFSGLTWRIEPGKRDLSTQSFRWRLFSPRRENEPALELRLPLLGKHQLANAATALATVTVLRSQGFAIPDDAVATGLAGVQWLGRFEVLAQHPFVIVDGAHNADSAHQLAETLNDYFPSTRLHLIFGASGDKDIAGMFAELLPLACTVTFTQSHNPRAADPRELARLAQGFVAELGYAPDAAHALKDVLDRAAPEDVICATGSLFIAADVRAAWFAQHGAPVETDG